MICMVQYLPAIGTTRTVSVLYNFRTVYLLTWAILIRVDDNPTRESFTFSMN